MNAIMPGGREPRPGRRKASRLAAWPAALLLSGGGLAAAGLLSASPAFADPGPDCPAAVVSGTTATVTCGYTGASQYWTVPAGVTQATLTVYGAEGGDSIGDLGGGGLGAEVTGTLTVTPGAVLQVNVGQAGTADGAATFGGGGAGGSLFEVIDAGSGGGESDVRTAAADGSYPLTDALLVAGGGGGWSVLAGDGAPGNADMPGGDGQVENPLTNECGVAMPFGEGGGAGGQSAGGAGGAGGGEPTPFCFTDPPFENGFNGSSGSLGTGGAGGGTPYLTLDSAGGGGGGGYYGGGGGGSGAVDEATSGFGGAGSGGGGSSYTGSTGATVTDGVDAPDDAPNGEVIISYQVSQPPAFTADSPALTGGIGTAYSYQFAASGVPAPAFSLNSGAPSWLSIDSSTGEVSGTPPKGTSSFSYSVTASNTAGSVTTGTYTVSVSANADVTAVLACPSGLTVGASGACTLTVTNNGPALATTVVAGAAVPAALKVTGCSPSCTDIIGALGWSLGSLPAGQSDTLTINVTAEHKGNALVVAADGALTPDPSLLNNVADATVTIAA